MPIRVGHSPLLHHANQTSTSTVAQEPTNSPIASHALVLVVRLGRTVILADSGAFEAICRRLADSPPNASIGVFAIQPDVVGRTRNGAPFVRVLLEASPKARFLDACVPSAAVVAAASWEWKGDGDGE